MCDKIPHTITIVRTEFNRFIAAYTPVPWEGSHGKWLADPSGKSFLLQLDLKQRLSLLEDKKQKAIWDKNNSGPVFGGENGKECDLWIRDKCN